MQSSPGIPPIVVWSIGLPLIIADAATMPYWHDVWAGILGKNATGIVGQGNAGMWRTAGLFLLLLILAGITEISSSAGVVVVTFLLALWVLFLVTHASEVQGFFSLFNR